MGVAFSYSAFPAHIISCLCIPITLLTSCITIELGVVLVIITMTICYTLYVSVLTHQPIHCSRAFASQCVMHGYIMKSTFFSLCKHSVRSIHLGGDSCEVLIGSVITVATSSFWIHFYPIMEYSMVTVIIETGIMDAWRWQLLVYMYCVCV